MSTRDEIAARIRAAETPEEIAIVIGAALDEHETTITRLRGALEWIAGAEFAYEARVKATAALAQPEEKR